MSKVPPPEGVVETPPDPNGWRCFEIAFDQRTSKFIEREIREKPTDLSEAGDYRAFIITRDGKDLTAEARQEAIRRIKRRMQKLTAVDFDLAEK